MVGKGAKKIRKIKGLSQMDLEKITGYDRTNISRWENGIHNLSSQTMEKICEALGVHPVALHWFGLERDELPEERRIKFDILKPSIDEYMKELFL